MRFALDARYIREKPSGIGTYVQALVSRLPAAVPSDRFLFWAHPLASHPLSSAPNTSEQLVRPGPNSPLPLWWPHRYAPFEDVDVFHSPHNLLPRGLSCATVTTVHDVMAIEHPSLHLQGIEWLLKRGYYSRAVWRALWLSTRIVAPTMATADRIRAIAPDAARRTVVLHEAPDPCFRPAADPAIAMRRTIELTGADAPFFLVVGANSPTKRHADAIAAFASVPRPWRLVLLQRQGPRSSLRKAAAAAGIADRIVWLPTVSRPDVVTLMQSAAALIQPSLYEGFGLPVLEAMACRCPVVASDIPPFREITDGAAVLVPPADVGRLATALRAVAASPSRRESMAAQGLQRAQTFSWDQCAFDTLQVYRDAAAAHGGS